MLALARYRSLSLGLLGLLAVGILAFFFSFLGKEGRKNSFRGVLPADDTAASEKRVGLKRGESWDLKDIGESALRALRVSRE